MKNIIISSRSLAVSALIVVFFGSIVLFGTAQTAHADDGFGGMFGGESDGYGDYFGGESYGYGDYFGGDEYGYGDYFGGDYDGYGGEFYPDEDYYGYEDDYGYEDAYYGGGYSMPSYSTGGGYQIYPRSVTPVTISNPQYPSSSGSQSQNQSQSQVSNNTNTNNNSNVNINNVTAVAVAQVQVGSQTASQPTYPTYPTYPSPYCTIYQAQYGSYNYGTNSAYLSWSSSNASSAYLSGYGSVAVNGSQTVYGSYTQTYTLTVYGYNGQSATCQTTVNSYVPTTPYVSLTQIPYTGFDFGPVGNAMYWAGMIVFALAGAYLAVYYVPALAFAGSTRQRSFAPVVAPKAPILIEKEATQAKVAPIIAELRKNGTTDSMAIVHVKGSMPKIMIDRS